MGFVGAQLVLRLNNAPTLTHERDLGNKTDVRLTNHIYEGFKERRGEAPITSWCAGRLQQPPCTRGSVWLQLSASQCFFALAQPALHQMFPVVYLHFLQHPLQFGFFHSLG